MYLFCTLEMNRTFYLCQHERQHSTDELLGNIVTETGLEPVRKVVRPSHIFRGSNPFVYQFQHPVRNRVFCYFLSGLKKKLLTNNTNMTISKMLCPSIVNLLLKKAGRL